MAQEIELKFIVAQDGVETLREQLNALEAKHTPAGQLLNIYYETADNWLRRHDMGLRIRGDQGRYEMTLKIAGRVVGGLHQRPEYNIPLDKPELALERLPAEVWPQGELPAALAEHVQPLFSTDFARERWVIQKERVRLRLPSIAAKSRRANIRSRSANWSWSCSPGRPPICCASRIVCWRAASCVREPEQSRARVSSGAR